MKPLVSIIIPNYNQEKYIRYTIEAALNQTYENTEIIIVDDGSTDSSYEIIKEYEDKYEKITAMRQENANASIARNRGFEHSSGKYVYFLDSDDVPEMNAIELMVKAMEENEADLVVGNMKEIDADGKEMKKDLFFKESGTSGDFREFLDVLPAPPNKLFKADILKNKHVVFGNVRIGQDTNFYLKYLLCCKKIAYLSDIIYGWRIVPTSMTHAMDFHIFDIVNSFKNVKNFYKANDAMDMYDDYIKMIEFHTYYRQMDKQRNFATRQSRMLVINYFDYYIKRLGDVSTCKNYSHYLDAYNKCNMKRRCKWLYASKLYQSFYKIKN